MSLFKKAQRSNNIVFMLRGEPGSGKSWFALALKRATGKPVAYIGTDRGAKFYADHPDIGGFMAVETRDAETIRGAVAELAGGAARDFGAVVLDTVTDCFSAEQAEYTSSNGNIPLQKWKPLREGHERLLRTIQSLPLHVALICEEKPVYERIKDKNGQAVELKEVGTKEDADKRDAYTCDVRLRFFIEDRKFRCEVLKDRTGTFQMGQIVDNPRPEMWIKGAVPQLEHPPAESKETLELKASLLVNRVRDIANKFELKNWKTKHRKEVESFKSNGRLDLFNAIAQACKDKETELDTGNNEKEVA